MKAKVKEFAKRYLLGFILGMLLAGVGTVIATTYFPSNQTTYDNSNSGMQATNVQSAIDELYNTCTAKPPATDTITNLLPSTPNELYKDEHGDIRYYGSNPNNYVNFNNELWRIIGIIDGKIKIIRNESIGIYAWASNNSYNWNNSDLKSYLNEDYYNLIDGTYKNMISEETYYLGGPSFIDYQKITTSEYYEAERNTAPSGNPISTKQYIGLMYPSDYGYAAGSSCLSTVLYNYNRNCKNSDWLFNGVDEWLQAPIAGITTTAAYLNDAGDVRGDYVVTVQFAVRPSLYLTSEVKITGGNGSQSNPYTIAN